MEARRRKFSRGLFRAFRIWQKRSRSSEGERFARTGRVPAIRFDGRTISGKIGRESNSSSTRSTIRRMNWPLACVRKGELLNTAGAPRRMLTLPSTNYCKK